MIERITLSQMAYQDRNGEPVIHANMSLLLESGNESKDNGNRDEANRSTQEALEAVGGGVRRGHDGRD